MRQKKEYERTEENRPEKVLPGFALLMVGPIYTIIVYAFFPDERELYPFRGTLWEVPILALGLWGLSFMIQTSLSYIRSCWFVTVSDETIILKYTRMQSVVTQFLGRYLGKPQYSRCLEMRNGRGHIEIEWRRVRGLYSGCNALSVMGLSSTAIRLSFQHRDSNIVALIDGTIADYGDLFEQIISRSGNIERIHEPILRAKEKRLRFFWQKEPDWEILNAAIARAEENRKMKEQQS